MHKAEIESSGKTARHCSMLALIRWYRFTSSEAGVWNTMVLWEQPTAWTADSLDHYLVLVKNTLKMCTS